MLSRLDCDCCATALLPAQYWRSKQQQVVGTAQWLQDTPGLTLGLALSALLPSSCWQVLRWLAVVCLQGARAAPQWLRAQQMAAM
jgi:hypothetical protein